MDGVRLVFVPPQRHLTVGLGQVALKLSFGLLLLLELLTDKVAVVPGRLQTVSQGVLGLGRRIGSSTRRTIPILLFLIKWIEAHFSQTLVSSSISRFSSSIWVVNPCFPLVSWEMRLSRSSSCLANSTAERTFLQLTLWRTQGLRSGWRDSPFSVWKRARWLVRSVICRVSSSCLALSSINWSSSERQLFSMLTWRSRPLA